MINLCVSLIRCLATIIPYNERGNWRQEWEAEILHFEGSPIDLLLRCCGALLDVVWIRQNEWSLDMFFEDLRYAFRTLRQKWGFTLAVTGILALGIGANTAVFSVIDAVLLRPLPYPKPERILTIWETNAQQNRNHEGPSPANLIDWRERSRSFDGMASWYAGKPVTLQGEQEAEKVQAAKVTADFFRVFGVQPAVGRVFTADELSAQAQVVVIGYGLWLRRFGGDAGVIGRNLTLDGETYKVVGVMPQQFSVPHKDIGFWLPTSFPVEYASRGGVPRDFRFLQAVGRLKDRVTAAQAEQELQSIASNLAKEYPALDAGWSVRTVPLRQELVGSVRTALLVLFAAVGFLLLIGCTNVANLLLARASGRGCEMAVRAALGASRMRLIRQLLAESLSLSAAGGLAGVMLAYGGLRLLVSMAPAGLSGMDAVAIDHRVLLFTTVLTFLTGLSFGIVPAVQNSKFDLSSSLKQSVRGRTVSLKAQRFRTALLVCEIAIAVTLLVGAGLITRTFSRIVAVDPGFRVDNVLVLRVFPDERKYTNNDVRLQYFRSLFDKLRQLPSVVSVGGTTGLPLNEFNNSPARPYWREGQVPAADGPRANLRMTTSGYFHSMGIPIREGRDFDTHDSVNTPMVVVINENLARRVWPGESALGKQLIIDYSARGTYPYQVIGVVGNTRYDGLKNESNPEIFLAHTQVVYAQLNVVVRTSGDPRLIIDAARRTILDIDPTQPVHSITTMADLVSRSIAQERFTMLLLLVLAITAFSLAILGVYSVMSFVVTQRTREIGVRIALGARQIDVIRLMMAQAGRVTLAGVSIGFVAAFSLTRVMTTLLYQVSATDPLIFVTVPAVVSIAALLASFVPVCRAMLVDPIEVLRNE